MQARAIRVVRFWTRSCDFGPAADAPRLRAFLSRDSTAIPVRERFPEEVIVPKRAARQASKRRKGAPKGAHARKKAGERGTRIERQRNQKLDRMLGDLPSAHGIGAVYSEDAAVNYFRPLVAPQTFNVIF